MLRFLFWRLLGLFACMTALAVSAWFLGGGPGKALRRSAGAGGLQGAVSAIADAAARGWRIVAEAAVSGRWPAHLLLGGALAAMMLAGWGRWRSRRRRSYVRLRVDAYRTDHAKSAAAVVAMYAALHKRLLVRWWRRLLAGQPGIALEVHYACAPPAPFAWLAVCCPRGSEEMVEAALRGAYANCRLAPADREVGVAPAVLRLKKSAGFIKRVKVIDRSEREREPPIDRLLTVMGACQESAFVQIAMTPAPAFFERVAKHLYKRHEAHLSRERREHVFPRDRSMIEGEELRGGLEVQHRPLYFVDLRIVAGRREVCERIASELRAEGAENHLVERGTTVRHGLLALYRRRVQRGEGNPLPSFHKGVFAPTEPHYLRQAQRYLGHAVRALRAAGLEVSLASIVEQLDPDALERLARTLPEPAAGPTHAYLDSLTPRQRADLAGVRDRMAILAESDVGRWLDPKAGGDWPFDLLEAVRARAVVYFNLDSDSRPLLTQMLGAAIVQDLQTTIAALQRRPAPTLALIDEFSALSIEQVARLFGRARSAGLSLVLGTQELADLRLPGRERLLEQVMGNLSVLVAHRQVLPESCALIASLAGTRGAWRTARHSDGRTTRTRTSEGVLAADQLMRLDPGWAAVTIPARSASARIVRVLSLAGR